MIKSLSVVIVIMLLLVGCGGTTTNDAEKSGSQSSPATTETASKDTSVDEEKAKKEQEAKQKAEEEAVAKKKADEEALALKKAAEEAALAELAETKYAMYAQNGIPLLTDNAVQLSEATYNFLVENNTLFPAFSAEDIKKAKDLTDYEIGSKHLNKNAAPYFAKMVSFEGYVVTVEEGPVEGSDDTFAVIHVLDDNDVSYQVMIFKSTGEIFEEDYVRFWGAPAGPWSFENIAGGSTNVQLIVGAHVEKV
jgi:uncharacterized protein YceK